MINYYSYIVIVSYLLYMIVDILIVSVLGFNLTAQNLMECSIVLISCVSIYIFRSSTSKIVGMMGIGYGLMHVISVSSILLADHTFNFSTFISVITLLVGLTLLFNGIILFLKYTRNTEMMRYSILVLIVLEIFIFMSMIHRGVDSELIIILFLLQLPNLSIELLFFILLSTEGIIKRSTSRLIRDTMFEIESGLSMGNDMAISREKVNKIIKMNVPEGAYHLKSEKNNMFLIIDYINGSPFLSFRDKRNTVGIGGLRFKLNKVVPNSEIENCKTVRFYGNNGIMIQLRVYDKTDNAGEKLFGRLFKN